MPPSNEYQQPGDLNPSAASESDEDLDLDELDVNTAPAIRNIHIPITGGEARTHRGYGPSIALRSLRSRAGNRIWRRDNPRSRQQDLQEDLDGLLEDHDAEERRISQGSSGNVEDAAPLLSGRRRARRHPGGEESLYSQLGSKLRLPSFMSTPAMEDGLNAPSNSGAHPDSAQKPMRQVLVGQAQQCRYPANVVSNAKYTPWSFLPRTLYNEFSFFFNIYFLLVAL
jgi:phospholipid-translocating ATPase